MILTVLTVFGIMAAQLLFLLGQFHVQNKEPKAFRSKLYLAGNLTCMILGPYVMITAS
jgi:hypothetical protein